MSTVPTVNAQFSFTATVPNTNWQKTKTAYAGGLRIDKRPDFEKMQQDIRDEVSSRENAVAGPLLTFSDCSPKKKQNLARIPYTNMNGTVLDNMYTGFGGKPPKTVSWGGVRKPWAEWGGAPEATGSSGTAAPEGSVVSEGTVVPEDSEASGSVIYTPATSTVARQ